jgi:hypothetical protein
MKYKKQAIIIAIVVCIAQIAAVGLVLIAITDDQEKQVIIKNEVVQRKDKPEDDKLEEKGTFLDGCGYTADCVCVYDHLDKTLTNDEFRYLTLTFETDQNSFDTLYNAVNICRPEEI